MPLDVRELYEWPVRALAAGSDPAQSVPPCVVCGATLAEPRFELNDAAYLLVVCSGCGLGRLNPMPGGEEVRRFYPNEYYGEPGAKFQALAEILVRAVGARHIGLLTRRLRAGARILDVGCGRGVLLGSLADRGFEVHGVEVSAEAAAGADPRAEIRIAPRLADAGYASESFDEVVIWHVLEHLERPREVLEEIHRILRPGGRLVVAVPNFSSLQARWTGSAWFHLDLPRHLHHFPLQALTKLLRDIGFDVESDHHFSLRQNPFGWLQSLLNCVRALPRNGLYVMLHRGAPPAYSLPTRMAFWCALVVGFPFAVAASVVAALLRSGATVHLVARRDPNAAPGSGVDPADGAPRAST